ncbi:MAG: ferrochelatase [Nitrospinota bacterium]|nr:MAG: ferrochelatase [Nitrospinota bacterium]
MTRYDSVLLIGFGGPTPGCCRKYDPCPGEAYCYVERILGADPSQAERVREVTHHYMELGGFSPYNELTFRQAQALAASLQERGIPLPVYVGLRNWTPYFHEVIPEMVARGHRQILGIIMAPHQSRVSWEKYQDDVRKAIAQLPADHPAVEYLDPWYTHPGFIQAITDRIREACQDLGEERFQKAALIFTAHAIPVPAARTSPYIAQYRATATAVAHLLGKEFDLAYQSAPDNTPVPWTGPDITELIPQKQAEGVRDLIVTPIGFLCDHVEVLYDLDIEAREVAEACGMHFIRPGTVSDHPAFIGMLADLISERVV